MCPGHTFTVFISFISLSCLKDRPGLTAEGIRLIDGREVEILVLDEGIPVIRHYVLELSDLVLTVYNHLLAGKREPELDTQLSRLADEMTNLVWPVLVQPFVFLRGESKAEFNLRRRFCLKGILSSNL